MTGTQISVLKALELVRNSETGEVHPGVDATLDREVKQIWSQIKTNPDYVMNKDEFAVFNYFQDRYKGEDLARKAVARFWNNFKGETPCNHEVGRKWTWWRSPDSVRGAVHFNHLIDLHNQ